MPEKDSEYTLARQNNKQGTMEKTSEEPAPVKLRPYGAI